MSKRYPGGILRKTPQTPSQTSAQGVWDMASVTQAVKENTWPIAGVPDPISKSLRFRSSASAYLNRTFATGNRLLFTFSAWVKRGSLTGNQNMFGPDTSTAGSGTYGVLRFVDGNLEAFDYTNGTINWYLATTPVYRDPSAWYHIVMAYDSAQATSSNRVKLYVNGVQVTALGTANYPTSSYQGQWNNNLTHYLGTAQIGSSNQYFDGYLAEVNFIDGQALTPSSFGGTNDQTGVWQPIAYTGTYGTNGFYLPFSNTASTATLGYDFSGNSNNWTTNNISLTSGSTYDSMVDVPTQWIPYNTAGDTGGLFRGNYCVLSPVDIPTTGSPATLSDGNLKCVTPSSGYGFTTGTIATSSGKWYWEYLATAGAPNLSLGFGLTTCARTYGGDTGSYIYYTDGKTYANAGAGVTYGATWTNGDVIAVALDLDAGTAVFYKNGVSQGTAFTGLSGTFFPIFSDQSPSISNTFTVNFGQRPFSYTPPAGYKTLCTTNLSTPTIGATASTTANKYFDATLYTGNNSTNNIVNSGSMQPDMLWIKGRSQSSNHTIQDSVRGVNRYLLPNLTGSEGTDGCVTAFNSNGFSLTTDAGVSFNANGTTYVGWQWRASNATAVTNTAGSITSTVSANTTAGFSIVTWTGNGGSSESIGTGLSTTSPIAMAIVKRRSGTSDWWVGHQGIQGSNFAYRVLLNSDAANSGSSPYVLGSQSSTNGSLLYLATEGAANAVTYVAYCFQQVAGYSAFGSYTGNGSSDGPFIFTGFRPRFIMIKQSSSSNYWWLKDSARSPTNQADLRLAPNLSNAESNDAAFNGADFLSNGFKLRGTDTTTNQSGGTYIYVAFAEAPFKYALAR